MLVAFPALTSVIENPLFCLATDFTVDNSLVVLRWTKCTPQSDPIVNKLDPHEDLAWRNFIMVVEMNTMLNSC
jgi:hypothetical protein